MARYIVRMKPGANPEEVVQSSSNTESFSPIKVTKLYQSEGTEESFLASSNNDEVHKEIDEIRSRLDRTFVVELNDKDASSTVVSLSNDDSVESIELDEEVREDEVPNDPRFNELFGLKKMECDKAWDTSTGKGVVVAVVDSGIDTDHPDLRNNLWNDGAGHHGFNLTDLDNVSFDISDDTGHGTHVAGTIGALFNNSEGVAGVAPNCQIMMIKGLVNGKGNLSNLLACIRKGIDNGARVINNSWGPGSRNQDAEDLLRLAFLMNITVIFSAGNNGRKVKDSQLASNPHVISVAAVDRNDKRGGFSNFGQFVTVSAPGVSILSTIPGGAYGKKDGTSMAAPHVSGLAALLISRANHLKSSEVMEIITTTADALNSQEPIGGRINARKALEKVNSEAVIA